MRVLLQRVSRAQVTIADELVGKIERGLLLLWGVGAGDTSEDLQFLVRKIASLRIFADAAGKMNLSVQDIRGDILIVSQFTLYASTEKGNRPSFVGAAPPVEAIPLYEAAIKEFEKLGLVVASGRFGADMKIELLNDGPVTIWLDSRC